MSDIKYVDMKQHSLSPHQPSRPIGEVIEEALGFLRKRNLRPDTLLSIKNIWLQVERFMERNSLRNYSAAVGEAFLEEKLRNAGISFSETWGSTLTRRVNELTDYLRHGSISRHEKLSPDYDSEIGRGILEFLAQKQTGGRFSIYTIKQDSYHLAVFLDKANSLGVRCFSELGVESIAEILHAIPSEEKSKRHHVIVSLRQYLRYLFGNGRLTRDLSRSIPKDAYRSIKKIPSVYSKDEVLRLCASVDRTNPLGKREYAILMVLSRFGLRASDVRDLSLDDIDWVKCRVSMTQYKTGNPVELPLTHEVGEALIDYIKYGRPKTELRPVFLSHVSPIRPLTTARISQMVSHGFKRAGIRTNGRKRGTHALRHSLASILLEEQVMLPVITEILGHKDTGSTKDYLSIDIVNLRKCALEVSLVSDSFYLQNNGSFYE